VPGLAATRVVVADDSALMRRLLADALASAGYEVVGEARDGDEALALCRSSRPDVLTLDLAMPGLDGLGVLRALRDAASPVPVVVVSAFSPAHGARAVDALAEGAVDLVRKPAFGEDMDAFLAELAQKVRLAAASRPRGAAAAPVAPPPPPEPPRPTARAPRAVVIATSTGGPRALSELVPRLPASLGRGALIVQHMPAGFTSSLAQRLDRASRLRVVEAAGGERLDPGIALLAPGGSHLRIGAGGVARLSDEAAIGGLRPRADLTIGDVASIYGENTLLVVLTGMGKDGLDGARAVKARGGVVLAEAEATCTVYGMPRAVVEAGLADRVLPLGELAAAIAAEAGR
jgi:two-component system chemotaxis response regulator CheB